jgi:hypothetical protein
MPDNGKKKFFQPSVAFWTHSSRLSRCQETGRLWNQNNKKNFRQRPNRCVRVLGNVNMVDHTPRYRPYDHDVDIHDKTLIDRRVAPYKFELSVRTDSYTEDPVPAFLSDYDGEPDPSEYVTPLRKDRRRSVSARILAGVLVTAAAAILFAMLSSDATRAIIVNAKDSISASLPAYAALQPDPAQLTARDTQLRNPNDAARRRRASQTSGVRAVTTTAVTRTPEEITWPTRRGTPRAAAALLDQRRRRGTGCRSAAGRPRAHDWEMQSTSILMKLPRRSDERMI